jgi:hypothetical protein
MFTLIVWKKSDQLVVESSFTPRLVHTVPVGNQIVSAQAVEGAVHVVEVRGVINPPVADYLQR